MISNKCGYDNISSKCDFQGPGIRSRLLWLFFFFFFFFFFEINFVIALAPTFIDGIKCSFTQLLGMTISQASSTFEVLCSRSRSLWLFLEKTFSSL